MICLFSNVQNILRIVSASSQTKSRDSADVVGLNVREASFIVEVQLTPKIRLEWPSTYPSADLLSATGGIGHGSSLFALLGLPGELIELVHNLLLIRVEVRAAKKQSSVMRCSQIERAPCKCSPWPIYGGGGLAKEMYGGTYMRVW